MRAVLVHINDSDLADRRAKGLDIWDEMWEGVLHLTPAPSLAHQRILNELIIFISPLLTRTGRGELVHGINVFQKSDNYRIPDLTFVANGREHICSADGVRGEGPDTVVEIRSPEDERLPERQTDSRSLLEMVSLTYSLHATPITTQTYDKLPFYAALTIREVVVIDRDTKRPEIFRLAGSQYVALQPDADGWLRSEAMNVRFRVSEGQSPRLQIEDAHNPTTHAEI